MLKQQKFLVEVEKDFYKKGNMEVLAESQKDANEIVQNMICRKSLNTSDSRIKWKPNLWLTFVNHPKTNQLQIKYPISQTLCVTYKDFFGVVRTALGSPNKIRSVLFDAGYNILNAY